MWVKIAELNTESEPRLVTGLSFHQRCDSSHSMARLHLPLRDPWPLSCLFMREHFLTFGVCEQPHVWGCCLPFIHCGLVPLWLNTSTKHIFSNVILTSVACVCLWCLSVGVWCCVSSQHGTVIVLPWCFLVHTRELPLLEVRVYNHFLIFVIPPNMLFKKRLDLPAIQFSLKD